MGFIGLFNGPVSLLVKIAFLLSYTGFLDGLVTAIVGVSMICDIYIIFVSYFFPK